MVLTLAPAPDLDAPTAAPSVAPPAHRRRWGRAIFQLFATVALLMGLTIATAPAASAYPGWYVPNGCTAPSIGHLASRKVEFRSACNRHDICYDWELNWMGEPGRIICDSNFYNAMITTCNNRYGAWTWGRTACYSDAVIFHGAVRTFGGPFFNNPWLN